MKSTTIIATTFALTLLMLGNAVVVGAEISGATTTSTASIPPQIAQYLSTHPGNSGCFSGTVDPFTIQSTSCVNTTDIQTQQTTSLTCTTECWSGTQLAPSSNDIDWDGFATLPSNPSNSFYGTTTASYWIGLQNCLTGSCSGTQY